MKARMDNFSPTLKRIVTLSVLLTLAAQIVLVYIGLSYANSIEGSISAKRKDGVLNQFRQNVLYQLNDINNLLLLIQTPEFSGYFKNFMNLRDDRVVQQEKQKLLDKLNNLNLSPQIVESIYFIGEDINQQSLRKETGSPGFKELPHLRMEQLRYAKIDSLFLPDHDQFTVYTDEAIDKHFRTASKLLSQEDIDGLTMFTSHIRNHLILANGNENGVFIVIVLDDHVFEQALPRDYADGPLLSVTTAANRVVWTNGTADTVTPSSGNKGIGSLYQRASYRNTVKELLPFRLRIVYSEQTTRYHFRSDLLIPIVGVSVLTLMITLLLSLFFTNKVLKPFRLISKKLRTQLLARDNRARNQVMLHTLPEELIGKGLHAISLRSQLTLVLLAAVSIPAITDGLLYSRFLVRDVERSMQSTADSIGGLSAIGIRNRVRFMENVVNEISVSEKFQDYVTARNTYQPISNQNGISLDAFPGLNDVSYFVLLDESGGCLYSSIYLNNKDMFKTDPKLLLNRGEPYWISGYQDVYKHISTAVVKRIAPNSENKTATYLLLVPKQPIFENLENGQINASYVITERGGQTIYETRFSPDFVSAGLLRFSQNIPDTDWTISIDYVFNEVIDKNRVYQEQFLLCMFIVLMLSFAAAYNIAYILVRPIKRLKDTMAAVGAGDFAKRVVYDEDNEIADIVKSYNSMIGQLDQTIRQNMSIMEENAANKIRENNLISMKTRAELHMLQAQINPHFLYNALEAINMRSLKSGNHEISVIVGALADLFRYSISKGGERVELDKELNHAANYVTIQQIRFGHSFQAEFDIPDELKGAQVLRFIVQPIIENSIKHGFAGWEDGGSIRISASKTGSGIQLKISDNGVGMDKQTLEQLKTAMQRGPGSSNGEDKGIGLQNVYQRLKLFYKSQMSMEVRSGLMKGTEIIMEFPLSVEAGSV